MQLSLFGTIDGTHWLAVRDANPSARALFDRHYSRRIDAPTKGKFVGPGEYIALMTPCGLALFVWRKFISADGQQGINCAIFRNESEHLSSELILEAEKLAAARWPGQRFFTYVNPRKIQSANPGYCFKCAGWRQCGVTKARKLLIFEKTP